MMNATNSKMLVTSALPYANGPIHLGHLVEHIQADIWVRFQRLRGKDCLFICGDDAHGTPIMISAQRQGITPEALIATVKIQHEADFKDFFISFDHYYTTHSPENQQLSEIIYKRLRERGDIVTRVIQQTYDPVENMFLPDRYVKGECPRCGAKDQYGDNCEMCGATYSPSDLKNPISVLSGATPTQKESEHYFFRLENYETLLREWISNHHLQKQVANKLLEWFTDGLAQWDISRDSPYFGFEIPDAPGKYFYVWLDAPIGYMASFMNLCKQRNDLNFDEYWGKNSQTQLFHFVGKDIIYFHALFWPAMLAGSDFRLPTAIFTHGFLTVNGQKMSKSRGTYITARKYLNHLHPDYLRYYFASKLSDSIDDIDLNFEDFMQRVNADLVGKVVNIASRCAGFITKYFNNTLSSKIEAPHLLEQYISAGEEIANYYTSRDYNRAVREIMRIADLANQYIDEKKPWTLVKQKENLEEVHAICSMGTNLFRILILYLKPILPHTASQAEKFLNISPLTWADRNQPLINHTVNTFEPLMQRIEMSQINTMLASEESPLNESN